MCALHTSKSIEDDISGGECVLNRYFFTARFISYNKITVKLCAVHGVISCCLGPSAAEGFASQLCQQLQCGHEGKPRQQLIMLPFNTEAYITLRSTKISRSFVLSKLA